MTFQDFFKHDISNNPSGVEVRQVCDVSWSSSMHFMFKMPNVNLSCRLALELPFLWSNAVAAKCPDVYGITTGWGPDRAGSGPGGVRTGWDQERCCCCKPGGFFLIMES